MLEAVLASVFGQFYEGVRPLRGRSPIPGLRHFWRWCFFFFTRWDMWGSWRVNIYIRIIDKLYYIYISKQPRVMDEKMERWSKICRSCFCLQGVTRNGPRGMKGYRIKTGSLLNVLSFYKSFMGPCIIPGYSGSKQECHWGISSTVTRKLQPVLLGGWIVRPENSTTSRRKSSDKA